MGYKICFNVLERWFDVNAQCSCPSCQSKSLTLITNDVRFGKKADIYKCNQCTLVFLDQKSFSFSEDFYKDDYHQTYLTHIEPAALNPQAYYEKMKKSNKIWVDIFRNYLKGDEVILDVGCSTGHFIDMIKDKAKAVYGHELNKKEIKFCRDVLKLDVADVPLENRFKEGMFDYITMIFVLEHIAEPVGFLNHLKKFLKPHGKIVILVPNIQDALVNFYSIPEFKKFYYCVEHLFYYSPKTIQYLFDKVGLSGSIEVIQEYPITNHINWAYTKAPSDVLASRRGVLNVDVHESVDLPAWTEFWEQTNQLYKKFLTSNGYGDRVWCSVGRK